MGVKKQSTLDGGLLDGKKYLSLPPRETVEVIVSPVFKLLEACERALERASTADREFVEKNYDKYDFDELIKKIIFESDDAFDASLSLARRIFDDTQIIYIFLKKILVKRYFTSLKLWSKGFYLEQSWLQHLAESMSCAYKKSSPLTSEEFADATEDNLDRTWAFVMPLFWSGEIDSTICKGRRQSLSKLDITLIDGRAFPTREKTEGNAYRRAVYDLLESEFDKYHRFRDGLRDILKAWDEEDCQHQLEQSAKRLLGGNFIHCSADGNFNFAYELRRTFRTCILLVRKFRGPWSENWAKGEAAVLRRSLPAISAVCLWAFDPDSEPSSKITEDKPFFAFDDDCDPVIVKETGSIPLIGKLPSGDTLRRFKKSLQLWIANHRFPSLTPCNDSAKLLLDAYAQDDNRAKVVFIATAMEALFKIQTGEGEPVGMTLRESIPHWFPAPERRKLRKDIQNFYVNRNKIVHGESTDNNRLNGKEGIEERELTLHITRAICRCIIEMVAWCLKQTDESKKNPDALDKETRARRLGTAKSCRFVFSSVKHSDSAQNVS